jgi:nitrogen regulatory protein PII
MMKMVMAIVRTTSFERIVKALEGAGVRSMTISQIKGIGEQVTLNTLYSIHDKIEILVSDRRRTR